MRQHRFRQIHRDDRGGRLALLDDAREASLAAADIGDALAGQIAQVFQYQLDVPDARIDGGRVMLLIRRPRD